jgi:hypothetical protein
MTSYDGSETPAESQTMWEAILLKRISYFLRSFL